MQLSNIILNLLQSCFHFCLRKCFKLNFDERKSSVTILSSHLKVSKYALSQLPQHIGLPQKGRKMFFKNVKFFYSVEKKFYTKILYCKVSQHMTNTKKTILFYIVTIQNQELKMKQLHLLPHQKE